MDFWINYKEQSNIKKWKRCSSRDYLLRQSRDSIINHCQLNTDNIQIYAYLRTHVSSTIYEIMQQYNYSTLEINKK